MDIVPDPRRATRQSASSAFLVNLAPKSFTSEIARDSPATLRLHFKTEVSGSDLRSDTRWLHLGQNGRELESRGALGLHCNSCRGRPTPSIQFKTTAGGSVF